MALPAGVSLVTVTLGPFLDFQGNALGGQTVFTPSSAVLHVPTGTPVLNKPVVLRWSLLGTATVQLPATDDPSLSPINFVYSVQHSFEDRSIPTPPVVAIQLPRSVPTVNLDLLIPGSGTSGIAVNLPSVLSVAGYSGTVTAAQLATVPELGAAFVSALEGESTVEPTGQWDFDKTPTVNGSPLGAGGSGTPADGSITPAKLSFDPATQSELDAGLDGRLPAAPINAQHTPYATAYADKPLVALRFDDADAVNLTMANYLAARNIPGGFAVHTNPLDTLDTGGNPYLTTANLLTMQQQGHEIMCHSKSHGTGPATAQAFLTETVGAAEILRGKGVNVQTFTQPGTWDNADYTMSNDALYETPAGRLFMANFLASQGYRVDDYTASNSNVRPLPVLNKYGARPLSADGIGLANLQRKVEQCIAAKGTMEVFWHLRNADLTNIVYPFILWLRDQKEAGRLDIVTPGYALNARPGVPLNLCPEGDLVAANASRAALGSYDYSNWSATLVGTNYTVAGRAVGRYAIRTNAGNQARWVVNGISHLRSLLVEGWVKSTDGSGASSPRGLLSVTSGGVQNKTATFVDGQPGGSTDDTTWRKVQWLVGIPPGANSLTLVLYAFSGSPIWTDLTIRPV